MPELMSSMPLIPLKTGGRIVFEAIDPGTGDEVSGVVVSAATITVRDSKADQVESIPVGPFMLTPGPDSAVS